jgi:hypothetical protein
MIPQIGYEPPSGFCSFDVPVSRTVRLLFLTASSMTVSHAMIQVHETDF